MTPLETTVFGALWLMLVALALLVLLLYRQVEKAYAQEPAGDSGIDPGSRTPALEVQSETGLVDFSMPSDSRPRLLVFVSTDCDKCLRLLRTLSQHRARERALIFVTGAFNTGFVRALRGLDAFSLGHPFDAERDWGITLYPTLFVISDGAVMARTTEISTRALSELLDEADAITTEVLQRGRTEVGAGV